MSKRLRVGASLSSRHYAPDRLAIYLAVSAATGLLMVKLSDWGQVTWFDPGEVGNVGEWVAGLAAGAAIVALGHQRACEREQQIADQLEAALSYGNMFELSRKGVYSWLRLIVRRFTPNNHESIVGAAWEINRYVNRCCGELLSSENVEAIEPYRRLIIDHGIEADSVAVERVAEWARLKDQLAPKSTPGPTGG